MVYFPKLVVPCKNLHLANYTYSVNVLLFLMFLLPFHFLIGNVNLMSVIEGFSNYLKERNHCVRLSSELAVVRGIPQGSIFGSIFFRYICQIYQESSRKMIENQIKCMQMTYKITDPAIPVTLIMKCKY